MRMIDDPVVPFDRSTCAARYAAVERRLQDGGVVILDGGTGTELERHGITMDPAAWCGPAALENAHVLEGIHRDYIAAGADVITANTYASSRLMLEAAGYGDRFAEINGAAIRAALRAREASGRNDLLVAGSLSHQVGVVPGTAQPDEDRAPRDEILIEAYGELAAFLRDEGCDIILLEMMYSPKRMRHAFAAATAVGLPVWAGFSARRGANGQILGFGPNEDLPIEEIYQILEEFDVAAAGIMHTNATIVGNALTILRKVFDGPLMAYPDSGYFKMPQWQFEDIIPPHELHGFATDWLSAGAQIVGGCCGLSPDHIAAVAPLKAGQVT